MKTGNSKVCSRKPLGKLETNTRDKENLVVGKALTSSSKDITDKSGPIKNVTENSTSKDFHSTAVQTDSFSQIDANELTSNDPPSETYWKLLAEQRLKALQKTLKENEELHIKIENLEKQKKAYKEMLEETNTLVKVLQEMIGNEDDESED